LAVEFADSVKTMTSQLAATMIDRSRCVLTDFADLRLLGELERFPATLEVTDEAEDLDLYCPLRFWICPQSGVVQVTPLIPLEVLYAKGHGSGTTGGIWKAHHEAFASFIEACCDLDGKSVLEIGAGRQRTLARLLGERHPSATWTAVDMEEPDPSQDAAPPANCRIVRAIFDADFRLPPGEAVEACVHSHFFEHAYDPLGFMRQVSRLLKPGDWHIFSVPMMVDWMKRGYGNALYFEHTFLVTPRIVEAFACASGFQIERTEAFNVEHSTFYALKKVRDPDDDASLSFDDLASLSLEAEANEQILRSYLSTFQESARMLEQRLDALPARAAEVYLFAATANVAYLKASGLDLSRFKAILDNDPTKHGRRLRGTSLLIQSPAAMVHDASPTVVVSDGPYVAEISRGLKMVRSDVAIVLMSNPASA
jgi:SAM-dependent methyltransferase